MPLNDHVVFTPAARAELTVAHDWYENEADGLGRRFREAVDLVARRMAANPRQFPVVFKDVRRALVRHFPYSLFFIEKTDALLVIACFHASRDPSEWRQRT